MPTDPIPPLPVVGHATLGEQISRMGRSMQQVTCCCGHSNWFYPWSWAGHGKAKCSGCKNWIKYGWGYPVSEPRQRRRTG